MAWESPIDRLLIRQVHLADRGEAKASEIREQVLSLFDLTPRRAHSAFHLGYAGTLLGLEWPQAVLDAAGAREAHRWFLLGRLRAHDRKHEGTWIEELCHDREQATDLLYDPDIASQALPIMVRAFFRNGDYQQAIGAIELLASAPVDAHPSGAVLIEAALNDLIARVEHADFEAEGALARTRHLLERCIRVPGFERVIPELQARYHRALAKTLLAVGEWPAVETHVERVLSLVAETSRVRSSALLLSALAVLHVPDLVLLEPSRVQSEGAAKARELLERGCADEERAAPEAVYALGVLAFGAKRFDVAARCFERALKRFRTGPEPAAGLVARARFHQGASMLAAGQKADGLFAARLIDQALDQLRPDLNAFYDVFGALKSVDRQVALRFLDRVDVGRGSAPDQILLVALEYQAIGEAQAAEAAALRVLEIATDIDQRIEALKVVLAARNLRGEAAQARAAYEEIRDQLARRGRFAELETLLKNESLIGLALDHVDIKAELIDVYDEMEGHEDDRVALQIALARSLRARKETEQIKNALAILREVEVRYPDLVKQDLEAIERILAAAEEPVAPPRGNDCKQLGARLHKRLGRAPRVLVVGGNERQRKHHAKFDALKQAWGIDGEWLMANYTSPQRLVHQVADHLNTGTCDLVLLLHWNRHETTEPALDLARKAGIAARTLYYAGFTSLEVVMGEMLQRLATRLEEAPAGKS